MTTVLKEEEKEEEDLFEKKEIIDSKSFPLPLTIIDQQYQRRKRSKEVAETWFTNFSE